MTEPLPPASRALEIALDAVTFLLFSVFVVFLFLGYLGMYAALPSTGLAAGALLGSLAVLTFANASADRRSAGTPPSNPA